MRECPDSFREQFLELEHLYRTAPVGMCFMDRDLRFVRINERLAEINGRSIEDHIGRTLREVVPEIAELVEPTYRRVIETGEPILDIEVRGTTPADPTRERCWLASYYPLKGDDGAVYGVSTVVQEITALKEAEQRQRESEERFRFLLETAPDAIVLIHSEGRIVLVNRQAERLFGFDREELVGQPVELLVPQRLRALHERLREGYFLDPQPRHMGADLELHGRRKDGTEFPVEITLSPIEMEGGSMALSSIRDISDRLRAEKALRTLSGRLINAQEEERSRIARELHDDLNQRLALLAVQMEQLGQDLPESASGLGERVRRLLAHTAELSSDVHRLSYQLHPSKLDHLGLAAALHTFCDEFGERQEVRIEFTHSGIPKLLPADIALCLYRIAQESLRNVVKHSGAKQARVELSSTGDAIHLRVSDSGVGFDPDLVEGSGLGLTSMRERLRLVRGEISIVSKPAHGTRVEARVPLPEAAV